MHYTQQQHILFLISFTATYAAMNKIKSQNLFKFDIRIQVFIIVYKMYIQHIYSQMKSFFIITVI